MNLHVQLTLLAIFNYGILAGGNDHWDDIQKIETGIDQLIHRIVSLEHLIDEREVSNIVPGYDYLSYQIQKVRGTRCRRNFFECSGNDVQCVNNLFVCDGYQDCRNGADERDCSLPVQAGDVIQYEITHWNIEAYQISANPRMTVDHVERLNSSSVQIRVTSIFPSADKELGRVLRATGTYVFATRTLEIEIPTTDPIGMLYNFNDNTITFTTAVSNYVYGKAFFNVTRVS